MFLLPVMNAFSGADHWSGQINVPHRQAGRKTLISSPKTNDYDRNQGMIRFRHKKMPGSTFGQQFFSLPLD
jgi:hypothetical protein